MLKNRRLVLLIVFTVVVALSFWGVSRYPALGSKAAMSGTEGFEDNLSPEAAFHPPQDAGWGTRVLYTSLNWYETNWRGMAFGLVLAGAFLTLLGYLPKNSSSGRFKNSFMGMLVGTPLGVCVNCVAPIAKGIYEAGSRAETALAVMFSSPTLNIVVLTMLFTIFPLYMGVMKLAATFLLVLVIVPLISRNHPAGTATGPGDESAQVCAIPPATEAWLAALCGAAADYWKSFRYIVVKTVPLMFLAGFLGALLSHLWSFDKLIGVKLNLASLALVAVMGTFLPLPIAFDLMLAQALMMSGMAPGFVMAMLFTLGTFSIYSAMIVARTFSTALAIQLFALVTVLGVGLGFAADYYSEYKFIHWLRSYEAFAFSEPASASPQANPGQATRAPTTPRPYSPFITEGEVRVDAAPHTARRNLGEKPFTKISGPELGITYSNLLTPEVFFDPFFFGRGIASGDIDGDGWTDIAIATDHGLEIYQNVDGGRFRKLALAGDLDDRQAIAVALVDLDQDGGLDAFVTTFSEGNFLWIDPLNLRGKRRVLPVPNGGALLTNAPGFADLDRDGFLDIVNGNYFLGVMTRTPVDTAVDHLVMNRNLRFELAPLPGLPGQTQTTLFSDINGDALPELMVGNDYRVADTYYLGGPGGALQKLRHQDGLIPVTTQNTMSMDTGDFNNDLKPDLYLANIGFSRGIDVVSNIFGDSMREAGRAFCDSGRSALDAAACHDMVRLVTLLNPERQDISERCTELADKQSVDECMVIRMALFAIKRKDASLCEKIDAGHRWGRALCENYFRHRTLDFARDEEIPMRTLSNVLLRGEGGGRFADTSATTGVSTAEWSWNARFADLDNDQWQDLYVVNGVLITQEFASNNFFHNLGGEGFASKAEEFGLDDYDHSSSYTYIDIDNDGDLDIIGNLLYGPFQVYINNEQRNHSVTFKLRDLHGNRFCIGCRITLHYGPEGRLHQTREIKASGGFHSFDAPEAHFGLGGEEKIDRVEVRWSTGETTLFEQPFPANRDYVLTREKRGSRDARER